MAKATENTTSVDRLSTESLRFVEPPSKRGIQRLMDKFKYENKQCRSNRLQGGSSNLKAPPSSIRGAQNSIRVVSGPLKAITPNNSNFQSNKPGKGDLVKEKGLLEKRASSGSLKHGKTNVGQKAEKSEAGSNLADLRVCEPPSRPSAKTSCTRSQIDSESRLAELRNSHKMFKKPKSRKNSKSKKRKIQPKIDKNKNKENISTSKQGLKPVRNIRNSSNHQRSSASSSTAQSQISANSKAKKLFKPVRGAPSTPADSIAGPKTPQLDEKKRLKMIAQMKKNTKDLFSSVIHETDGSTFSQKGSLKPINEGLSPGKASLVKESNLGAGSEIRELRASTPLTSVGERSSEGRLLHKSFKNRSKRSKKGSSTKTPKEAKSEIEAESEGSKPDERISDTSGCSENSGAMLKELEFKNTGKFQKTPKNAFFGKSPSKKGRFLKDRRKGGWNRFGDRSRSRRRSRTKEKQITQQSSKSEKIEESEPENGQSKPQTGTKGGRRRTPNQNFKGMRKDRSKKVLKPQIDSEANNGNSGLDTFAWKVTRLSDEHPDVLNQPENDDFTDLEKSVQKSNPSNLSQNLNIFHRERSPHTPKTPKNRRNQQRNLKNSKERKKTQTPSKRLKIDKVKPRDYRMACRWLRDNLYCHSATNFEKLHEKSKNGVFLFDLINKLNPKPVLKNKSYRVSEDTPSPNYRKVFAYLEKFQEFNPRYLNAEKELKEGNRDVFWGLILDLFYFSNKKVNKYDRRFMSNTGSPGGRRGVLGAERRSTEGRRAAGSAGKRKRTIKKVKKGVREKTEKSYNEAEIEDKSMDNSPYRSHYQRRKSFKSRTGRSGSKTPQKSTKSQKSENQHNRTNQRYNQPHPLPSVTSQTSCYDSESYGCQGEPENLIKYQNPKIRDAVNRDNWISLNSKFSEDLEQSRPQIHRIHPGEASNSRFGDIGDFGGFVNMSDSSKYQTRDSSLFTNSKDALHAAASEFHPERSKLIKKSNFDESDNLSPNPIPKARQDISGDHTFGKLLEMEQEVRSWLQSYPEMPNHHKSQNSPSKAHTTHYKSYAVLNDAIRNGYHLCRIVSRLSKSDFAKIYKTPNSMERCLENVASAICLLASLNSYFTGINRLPNWQGIVKGDPGVTWPIFKKIKDFEQILHCGEGLPCQSGVESVQGATSGVFYYSKGGDEGNFDQIQRLFDSNGVEQISLHEDSVEVCSKLRGLSRGSEMHQNHPKIGRNRRSEEFSNFNNLYDSNTNPGVYMPKKPTINPQEVIIKPVVNDPYSKLIESSRIKKSHFKPISASLAGHSELQLTESIKKDLGNCVLKWINALGVLKQVKSTKRFNFNTFQEILVKMNDGLILARVVETVLGIQLKGIFEYPYSELKCLMNIKKALDALKLEKEMPKQFLYNAENIYSMDFDTCLGLLEQIKELHYLKLREAEGSKNLKNGQIQENQTKPHLAGFEGVGDPKRSRGGSQGIFGSAGKGIFRGSVESGYKEPKNDESVNFGINGASKALSPCSVAVPRVSGSAVPGNMSLATETFGEDLRTHKKVIRGGVCGRAVGQMEFMTTHDNGAKEGLERARRLPGGLEAVEMSENGFSRNMAFMVKKENIEVDRVVSGTFEAQIDTQGPAQLNLSSKFDRSRFSPSKAKIDKIAQKYPSLQMESITGVKDLQQASYNDQDLAQKVDDGHFQKELLKAKKTNILTKISPNLPHHAQRALLEPPSLLHLSNGSKFLIETEESQKTSKKASTSKNSSSITDSYSQSKQSTTEECSGQLGGLNYHPLAKYLENYTLSLRPVGTNKLLSEVEVATNNPNNPQEPLESSQKVDFGDLSRNEGNTKNEQNRALETPPTMQADHSELAEPPVNLPNHPKSVKKARLSFEDVKKIIRFLMVLDMPKVIERETWDSSLWTQFSDGIVLGNILMRLENKPFLEGFCYQPSTTFNCVQNLRIVCERVRARLQMLEKARIGQSEGSFEHLLKNEKNGILGAGEVIEDLGLINGHPSGISGLGDGLLGVDLMTRDLEQNILTGEAVAITRLFELLFRAYGNEIEMIESQSKPKNSINSIFP